MLDKLLNDEVLKVLGKGLDSADLRHKISAHNIANVDTPNYKRVLVSFEEELKLALGQGANLEGAVTKSNHIPINAKPLDEVKSTLYGSKDQTLRMDGNNVDINIEMANMGTNSLKYNALTTLFTRKIQMLKMVMRDRTA